MSDKPGANLETDPRFPSGKWAGFFLQKHLRPGRYSMELLLTFLDGALTGTGRDVVGSFEVHGTYQLGDGHCHWTKHYVGKHEVAYKGFNEGKGIWGVWEIRGWDLRGGFHIWPEEWGTPSDDVLFGEADLPAEAPSEA